MNESGYKPSSDEARGTEKPLSKEEKQALIEKILDHIEIQAREIGVDFEGDPKAQVVENIRGWKREVIIRDNKIYYQSSLNLRQLAELISKEILLKEKAILTPNYNENGLPEDGQGRLTSQPKIFTNYEVSDRHPLQDEIKALGLEEATVLPYPEHYQEKMDKGWGNRECYFVSSENDRYELEGWNQPVRYEHFLNRVKQLTETGQEFIVTPDPQLENPYEYAITDIPCAAIWRKEANK